MKGYKVTDSQRSKIVGVACSSLAELEAKGKDKMGLKGEWVLALEDGTLVQDQEYFLTLPTQSLLIFYKHHEPILTSVDVILNALRNVNATYLNVSVEAAEAMRNKIQELSELLNNTERSNHNLGNTREEDSQWFEGLETNARTKEDFMYKKAQDRIRGYLYKFQDDIRKSILFKSLGARKTLTDCINFFKQQLAADDYFGCYFDRRFAPIDSVDSQSNPKKFKFKLKRENNEKLAEPVTKVSYCDINGLFYCEGVWKIPYCAYAREHAINPYLNKESRVIFSTWNLDHRIEKSRTILPALLSAVQAKKKDEMLNVDYFYRLLFTRINLKLVHIVCHDKASHDLSCDDRLMLIHV